MPHVLSFLQLPWRRRITVVMRSLREFSSLLVTDILAQIKTVIKPQAPFSPDLADFVCSKGLEETHERTIEEKNTIRGGNLRTYQKVDIRAALRIGKNTDTSVIYLRGTTLKKTK